MSPDAAVALALDAFLSEHPRCWQLYGEGLKSDQNDTVCWLACAGCGAFMTLGRR